MNLIELSKYLQDESLAESYLLEKGVLQNFTNCPYCNSIKVGQIRRGRIKCYTCKKEWNKRKGSFLEGKQISAAKFIAFLKLYSMDYGTNEIVNELNFDVKTVIKISHELRKIITYDYLKFLKPRSFEAIIFEESNRIVVKFIKSRAEIDIKMDCYLIQFQRQKDINRSYLFSYKAFNLRKNKGKISQVERFMSLMKTKLQNYNGIKLVYMQMYILELCYFYNNRGGDLMEMLLKKIAKSKGG